MILDKKTNDCTVCFWETKVSSFDADKFCKLKLSTVLKYQQEACGKHVAIFGAPSDVLRDEHSVAFVFTKIKVTVNRLPKAHEDVVVKTWCSSLKGVRFTRNFVMYDGFGEILTESKAEVVVIDLKTRKIIRPTEIPLADRFLYNDEQPNGCEYPQKIKLFEEKGQAVTRKVSFSDVDENGHMNNTVYADVMCDCLSDDLRGKTPTEFTINFENEAFENETIEIFWEQEENEVVFVGQIGEKQCFKGQIKY